MTIMPCPSCFGPAEVEYQSTKGRLDQIVICCKQCKLEQITSAYINSDHERAFAIETWNQCSWLAIGAILGRLARFLDQQEIPG